MNSSSLPQRSTVRKKKKPARKRKKRGFFRTVFRVFMFCLILLIIAGGWLYLAPSAQNTRYLIADTLITTQHRYMAKYIIGEDELKNRVSEYTERFQEMGNEVDTHVIEPEPVVPEDKPLVEIEKVTGSGYAGYVMIVNDPKKVRLGVPDKVGSGEKVSSMVARTGAIAGVNGGASPIRTGRAMASSRSGWSSHKGSCTITDLAARSLHRLWVLIKKAK